MIETSVRRRNRLVALSWLAALAAFHPSSASAADFFRGKSVRIVIGMPPGGGVDAYARLLQRHINRYVPGEPAMIAQNAPGAGSLRAIQSLGASPDDGTTIVTFTSALLPEAVLNPQQVKIDFRDYRFIGNISEDTRVCYVRKGVGLATVDELRRKEIIWGATTASQPEASMLRNVLGIRMQIVMGYAGASDKRLALEKGEVDGDCGGWTSIPASWRRGEDMQVFLRVSPTLLPGMDAKIPYGGDLLADPKLRQIFDFLTAPTRIGRPFIVKSTTPPDQLATLRDAFDKTMKDPEFLAEAAKMELTVTPTRGAEVDQEIAKLYATPPNILEDAKRMSAL